MTVVTLPAVLCEPCSGTGQMYDWLIPGYRWGTVQGVRNHKAVIPCRCCNGRGRHEEACNGYDEPSIAVPVKKTRAYLESKADVAAIPSTLPQDLNKQLFAACAKEAIHVADRVVVDDTAPGLAPFYNVYLDEELKVIGFTTNLKTVRDAVRRRRQVFSQRADALWAVSFSRLDGGAAVHHRAGFRARFQQK